MIGRDEIVSVLVDEGVSRLCGVDYELASIVTCFEKAGLMEDAQEAERLFKSVMEFRHRLEAQRVD